MPGTVLTSVTKALQKCATLNTKINEITKNVFTRFFYIAEYCTLILES